MSAKGYMKGYNYRKAIQALCYFAKLAGGRMSKMKAIKLIWLADRLHLRRYSRAITDDFYYAMEYGPVASSTLDILNENDTLGTLEKEYSKRHLRKHSYKNYDAISDPDFEVFSDTDVECLDEIYNNFGGFTASQLSRHSHKFPEWNKYESELTKGYASRMPMSYDDFFKNVKENSNLFNEDEDLVSLSKEIFHEDLQISKVL